MSTLVNFTPSTTAIFSFQAQLAGSQYMVSTPWNVQGQRYYLQVADLSGNVVLYTPLIASGPQLNATFSWANGYAVATTAAPHWVPVGRVVMATVSQTDSAFDGTYQALATGLNALAYPLTAAPAEATPIAGVIGFDFNLLGSVIPGAYIKFRYGSQQFEYGP